jgi:hypothetical protein
VLLTFGALTFLEAPRLQSNLPTPWIGLWERINISVFLLWVVVLAALLLQNETSQERGIISQPFPFKTPEGEAMFLAAYDAVLKRWPVPFEELDIPTRFGMTHVVAAGPKNTPALVLLHGYMATSVMWAPNIADFSQDYRVYAIDVMGQPSKSMSDEPIGDAADYVAWLTATRDGLNLGRVSLLGMSFGGSLQVPVLLLFGDEEVICRSAEALERAGRLIPHFGGELIPRCRHDMCFSQSRIVDARVLDFLAKRGDQQPWTEQRSVA